MDTRASLFLAVNQNNHDMTKDEIRAQLNVVVKLNPKGHCVINGEGNWGVSDGGNYNGYVEMPIAFAKYFPEDDYGYPDSIPEVHGGCTFANQNKAEGKFTVGFDTLHYNDTEAFWTKERTIAEAEEWADKIAECLYEVISEADDRANTPYMTVSEVMDLLKKYHPSQHIAFLSDGVEYKQLVEYGASPENVVFLACACQVP